MDDDGQDEIVEERGQEVVSSMERGESEDYRDRIFEEASLAVE